MIREWTHAFPLFAAVFLAVTGGEALYADLGHFGARSIRLGWFAVVLPALVLNYLGQAALLTADPSAIRSPFFLLAPESMRFPLTLLATFAAIIASQALISGAFHEEIGEGIQRVTLRFGFTETPDVPAVLKSLMPDNIRFQPGKATCFLGSETYGIGKKATFIDRIRLYVFAAMARNASRAKA